jgi:hypothetical protein
MELSDLKQIVAQFKVKESVQDIYAYGSGHINDTYKVETTIDYYKVNYILQRINHKIFTQPMKLQENVAIVSEQMQKENAKLRDGYRRSLILIKTNADGICYVDEAGNHWRMYEFTEHTHGYDIVENESQAYQASKAFGAFLKSLSAIPSDKFYETIPNFHHTPSRYATLLEAIKADKAGRAASCKDEIDFFLSHSEIPSLLLDLHAKGEIPMRVTHNDTKMNNVLLDSASDEAMCVIDLDTVMPGLVHYDFGDLVRTSTSPAAEDEKDIDKVFMRLPIFKALLKGYLTSTFDVLNPTEVKYLPFAGKLITFEIGMRFLTDYLDGDNYFKTHYDNHNLVRCRTQVKLVQSMEEQADDMEKALQEVVTELSK